MHCKNLYPKFEACLQTLLELSPNQHNHLAVAISGGPDSFALLHLTKQFCDEQGFSLTALTVDHQLRAESAKEAEAVASYCHENNIPHQTLVIEDFVKNPPQTKIQEVARNKRFQLLERKSSEIGATALLLGQHYDDQLETILMREGKKSGLYGLAAMPSVRYASQLDVIRPLLDIRKADLLAYCHEQDLPFIEDPSNKDENYERVRIRKILKDPVEQNRALKLMQEAIPYRQKIDAEIVKFVEKRLTFYPERLLSFALKDFKNLEKEVAVRLLPKCIELIKGQFQFYKFGRKEALYEKILGFEGKENARHVFGGCELCAKNGEVYIYREPASIQNALVLTEAIGFWDSNLAYEVTDKHYLNAEFSIKSLGHFLTHKKRKEIWGEDDLPPYYLVGNFSKTLPMI